MYWLSSAHHQASVTSLSNSSHGNIIYNTQSAFGDLFCFFPRTAAYTPVQRTVSRAFAFRWLSTHHHQPKTSRPPDPLPSPSNCYAITLNFILFHQQQFFYLPPPPPPPLTTNKRRPFFIKSPSRARLPLIEIKMQWMIQVVFSKCCCQI